MRILIALCLLCGLARAQPTKITIGIYTPSVEFGSASARLQYVKTLAASVASSTGLVVEAESYANLGALTRANVDFAIVDGPCYATNLGWRLLATATVGGGPARTYALFSNGPTDLGSLRGKLAYVATGCNDAGFIDNAMLEGEPSFFGARTGKQDLTGAIAEVASYKTAQAVFAPVGAAKGLTKLFETGPVPNPAFVALPKAPAAVIDRVASAVVAYGGGGAIAGWTKPSRDAYAAFAGRLGKVVKAGVLAVPETVRLDARDVLIDPPTLREPATIDLHHLLVRSPGRLE